MACSGYRIGESSGCKSQGRFKYHVFLSFRGPDVRLGFIDHLCRRLEAEGLTVFLDKPELDYGEKIMPKLYKAIEESRLYVITLSPGYAESRWCLEELVKIMSCTTSSLDQNVIPVFYKVEPRDVRHQTGPFAEAFTNLNALVQADDETVSSYKTALEQIGQRKGFSLDDVKGYEGQLVDDVVKEVINIVCPRKLFVKENIVGRDSIVQDISTWLQVQDVSNHVEVGMIYGAGGMGKSTISQIVYNNNLSKFTGSCFVADYQREASENNGLTRILEQIISDVSKKPPTKVPNIPSGLMQVKEVVGCTKTLLILDDVDDLTKLEEMFKYPGFFHPGSKIIITTRNQEMRKVCKRMKEFSVGELVDGEAVKLFSLNAFQSDQPQEKYKHLSRRFIDYCQGLPLALCVLASSLSGKPQEDWECLLQELVKCPADGIQSILKVSFDSLKDKVTKDLFLDIAHYFVRVKKDEAFTILEGLNLRPKFHFPRLVDRCLVTIDGNGKLLMHKLIQEMALDVVRQESHDKPGDRSRLLKFEDSYSVLRRNKGTENVRCLCLDSRNTSGVSPEEFLTIKTDAFTKMKNLELLQLYHVRLTGDYSDFPQEIKWLLWDTCPLSSMPTDLELDELVVLDMPRSSLVHVWGSTMVLIALKVINISYSTELVKTPDFSECPALERIDLEGCSKLVEIHESVTQLSRLAYLNVNDCISLRRIPCPASASVDAYNCQLVEIGDGVKLESRTGMAARRTDFMGFSGLESFYTCLGDGPFGCYKGVYQCGLYSVFLAGDHIDKWFITTAAGSQLNYTIPDEPGRRIRAFNICCVYECTDIIARGILEVSNQSMSRKWLYNPIVYPMHLEVEHKPHTWLTHWPIIQHREVNDGDELVVKFHHSLDTKAPIKYGFQILYEDESIEAMDNVRSFEESSNERDADWYDVTFRNVGLSKYEHETEQGVYNCWDSRIHLIYNWLDSSIHLNDRHGISRLSQTLTALTLAKEKLKGLLPAVKRSIPYLRNPAPTQIISRLRLFPSKSIMLEKFMQFPREDSA